MSFWKQVVEAIKMEITGFFAVPWPSTVAAVLVVGLLIFEAYWRTTRPMDSITTLVPLVTIVVIVLAQRYLQ